MIDGIIFDTAYTIAGKMTGCQPTRMGECKEFDEAFDAIQEAINAIGKIEKKN